MMFFSPATDRVTQGYIRRGQVEFFLRECFSSYDFFLSTAEKQSGSGSQMEPRLRDEHNAESTSLLLEPKPSQALYCYHSTNPTRPAALDLRSVLSSEKWLKKPKRFLYCLKEITYEFTMLLQQ